MTANRHRKNPEAIRKSNNPNGGGSPLATRSGSSWNCPGWVLPLMSKVGYYYVYNLIDLQMPRCQAMICEHIEDAREQLKLVLKRHKGDRTLVKWNFPEEDK